MILITNVTVLSQAIAKVATLRVKDAAVAFKVLDVPFNDCGLHLELIIFRCFRILPPFSFLPMQKGHMRKCNAADGKQRI